MPIIQTKPLDVNKFWDRTPTPLKYLLLIALIIAGSYFLVSKKVDNSQVKELEKIEQSIDVTYDLVARFEIYQNTQNTYNAKSLEDIKKVYSLVQELNSNINTKFDLMTKSSGKYNQDLVDKLILLNQSFEKLSKAYEPVKSYEQNVSITPLKK
jgi:hypothetical protein